MLNVGAIYGAMTCGASSWLYGFFGGRYTHEAVVLVDAMGRDAAGLHLRSTLGDLGLLAAVGMLLGACIGSIAYGRCRW